MSEVDDEFQTLSARLEEHAISSNVGMKISEAVSKPTVPAVSIDEKMKQHRILSKGWDEVVSHVRGKCGFADFLRPVPSASCSEWPCYYRQPQRVASKSCYLFHPALSDVSWRRRGLL